MKIRIFLSVAACKLTFKILRLFKKGATSLPGKIALLFNKDILKYLSSGVKTIIVTGTNGKTTTCRMIEQGFIDANLSYFSNKQGANLLNGIVTAFCMNSTFKGEKIFEYALIECDEATLHHVTPCLNVFIISVTNLFKDQTDRYGDIENVVKLIQKGIENCKEVTLCLNADCHLTYYLKELTDKPTVTFGIHKDAIKQFKDTMDSGVLNNCINCGNRLNFEYTVYDHLGEFICPVCGYKRTDADISVKNIISTDEQSSMIRLTTKEFEFDTKVNLPGIHNIYNAVCATATLSTVGIKSDLVKSALSSFSGGYGRMETFVLNNLPVNMILVKNAAGFNQVINYITSLDKLYVLVMILNNKASDGTDISWIDDVNFEKFLLFKKNIVKTYVSGLKATEMDLRLKIAGFDINDTVIIDKPEKLLKAALEHNKPVYILPTYSAMLDMRKYITKKYSVKNFYE